MIDVPKRAEDVGGARGPRHRVLYLVGQLGYGGSEGQLRLLLEHLDQAVWEPHVLVYHPSPNADHATHLSDIGARVAIMPAGNRRPLGKVVFTARVALGVRPVVVHSWTVHDNPYAALSGRLVGASVRWGSLRSSTRLDGFQSLPSWYRRFAMRSVQRIVVNSRALVAELRDLGIGGERVIYLPGCVEPSVSVAAPSDSNPLDEFGFSAFHRVFGNVGNIRRAKNQVLFVRALARVMTGHPEARGLIVGETLVGEEHSRAEIEREIERSGLSGRVVMTGFRADVRQIMAGLAALCLTSNNEGMPNVVLEAMAEAVPVVATAVGGVPDVVRDGETGLLVEPGDENGLASAMARVLDEPAAMARMATVARGHILNERGCAAMAKRLEAAYLDALRTAAEA